nr:ABC transporter permease [Streptomyces boncukensis]
MGLAVLVLVTAFTAAALPRALDASADDALRDALSRAHPDDRLLSGTAAASPASAEPGTLRERVAPDRVRAAEQALREAVRPPLRLDRRQAAYGVRSTAPAEVRDRRLPRPSPGLDPRVTLTAQAGLTARARLTAGRLPDGTVTGPEGGRRLQAAVSARTARTLKLRPGDTLHLPSGYGETSVEITGVYAPRGDPGQVRASPYWNAEDSLVRPTLVPVPVQGGSPKHYWHFSAVIHPRAAPALLDLREGAELFWHYPVDQGALHAHQVEEAERQLASLSSGPRAARLQERAAVGRITVEEGLAETLSAFRRDRSALSPLLLIALLGLATAGTAVLLLSGALAADRRREELALLRARGGSLPGIAGRLLAETAAVAVPAGAVGTGLALLAVPGSRSGAALAAACGATAVAALALPVRGALGQRRARVTADRADVARARPSRRRRVVELTVLALVAGAVVAVRQRGTADGGDALLALAPVLLACAAALLLMRCYPLPLRLLSRAAARRPGPVAFLGLARAGRAPSAAVSGLALLALLVALTVASFGGTVLAGVAQARDRAALAAVGADARIEAEDGGALPAGLPGAVRKVPGVREAAAYRTQPDGELTGLASGVTVILADAPAYARIADRTGQGGFPARALRTDRHTAASEPLPALVSPGLARGLGGRRGGTLALPGLQVPVRAELVRDETPAARGGAFLVLSREAVARARPDARGTALLAADTVLVDGPSADGAALRALAERRDGQDGKHGQEGKHGQNGQDGKHGRGARDAREGGRSVLVLRSAERARFADSALQSGAERLYTAAVLASAGYAALAVLLSLLHTAPERLALLARLRTLGLPRRQGRGMLLLESLPLYAMTACAGALTGLATVPLLGPGIDLTALAGTPDSVPAGLRADPAALLLPPLALLVLAAAGLLVQSRLAGLPGRATADLRTEPP